MKLLAVSRMAVPVPNCAPLELQKLCSSSAVDLLRHITEDPTADAHTLGKLADVCGYNATAMTLVGTFINNKLCTAQVQLSTQWWLTEVISHWDFQCMFSIRAVAMPSSMINLVQ